LKKKPEIPDGNDYLKFLTKEKSISDLIINNSRSMITIINRDYIYEKVNSTFCNEHRVVLDTILGKSLEDVWGHETFQNEIKRNVDTCFTGKTVQYEATFFTPQSGKRHFEVVFRPISIEPGKITHLLAETFDIDDLKNTKQAIKEKEEELRKFESNLPIGFLRCDPEGKILQANEAFTMIADCHGKMSITQMNLKNFYLDEELFEFQIEQLSKSHTKNFGRISLKNCSGKEIPCRLSGFLAVNRTGTPAYIDFAVEDCSRELMLENRLLQAQKLETIGSLAGGIAHDFNNILATISGYSEMLHEDLPKNSELSDKVNKIQGAVKKAQSITNQILTFSRHVEQEKVLINVSEVLKETIGFIKSSIPSNIILKSRIPKMNANILADPTQLFRVFLNLMTNAIQAMEETGGTLSVNIAVVQKEFVQHELNKDIVADEYVLLTFKDTGEGMEPSLIGRIFEPFFTTREVGKGTGLGLSVIHGIVTEMEGEIVVSSKKEKGSQFNVYLPVSKNYSLDISRKGARKRILFITGNKYESRILSLALESAGYELIFISDGNNFVKVMKNIRERPDMVIYMSDSKQIIPDDLVEIFRSQKIITPCILITDPILEISDEKLLSSGIINQHLTKPVSLKEIRNAIQELLR
jgi:signal transduction histidine kinase/PAS domain-containing protein/CheY-like chemotaxis protein